MQAALIVDAVRSPIGKRNGSLASIRGDELAAQVLNGLVHRQDLDPAEVQDVQLGCVTQIGEQGWNIGRMVPLVAGWPETVCGHDRRPSVRLVDADELQRRGRNLGRAARPRRLGGRRDDVARPDGLERRRPLRQAARPLADRAAGDLGRSDRRRVGLLARGARRVLARVASSGGGCERRGSFRRRNRPDRPHQSAHRRRVRRGRDAASGHVGRGARSAQAGVPRRRER